MNPLFSVIIPLFNKETYIIETLNSVVNQTCTDFEIIIIDDGSTDNSFNLISKFKDDRIIIYKQENQGAAEARNNGIKNSKGKYIALLDADDLWYTNHLNELKKQIYLFPDAGLFCNNYDIKYNENTVLKANFNFEYKNEPLIVKDYFKASIINAVAWTSAVAFTKKKFDTVGCFNPDLEIAEDLDLWNRFALKYKVSFNPKITMLYKFNINDSLSKKENNQIRYNFIKSFSTKEKDNRSLKLYLDINRFAVGLRCKLNNDKKLYKKLKKEIDFNNLNYKQKILLNCPNFILKLLKKIQKTLLKNAIYLAANK